MKASVLSLANIFMFCLFGVCAYFHRQVHIISFKKQYSTISSHRISIISRLYRLNPCFFIFPMVILSIYFFDTKEKLDSMV